MYNHWEGYSDIFHLIPHLQWWADLWSITWITIYPHTRPYVQALLVTLIAYNPQRIHGCNNSQVANKLNFTCVCHNKTLWRTCHRGRVPLSGTWTFILIQYIHISHDDISLSFGSCTPSCSIYQREPIITSDLVTPPLQWNSFLFLSTIYTLFESVMYVANR